MKLYEGARVRLRNGEIVERLELYPTEDYPWTGVTFDTQFTWAASGHYYHRRDDETIFEHDCDIVEVLNAPDAAATKLAMGTTYGVETPINSISRADVEEFKSLHDVQATKFNTLALYQRIATKSAIYPGKGTPFGLMYVALGLAEAGKVQNKVKKAFRDDGVIEFTKSDEIPDGDGGCVFFEPLPAERRAQIIKELGGALWYIAAMCNEIEATMSEVALTNLEEIAGRTERGTLAGDGDDR